MNVFVAIATVTAFGFVDVTSPSTAAWLDDYGTALQVARLAQRPLLVVIENPNRAEHRLDEINDDERLTDLLAGYELCRVDVTTDYGQKVAASYGATTFPYTAITDNSCRSVVFRGVGKLSPEIWERTLSLYSEASAVSKSGENLDKTDHPTEGVLSLPFAHADLEAAEAATQRSGRPLLVFVTMPGCYHCVRMKSETYQDRSLQLRIARDFESVVVDQTDHPDWVHDKNVTLFPTTLVLSQNGEVLSKMPGYVSAHELASRLESLSNRSFSQL